MEKVYRCHHLLSVLVFLALSVLVHGTPLRGSRHAAAVLEESHHQRRQVKEKDEIDDDDDDVDDEDTSAPTAVPSGLPTAMPSDIPTDTQSLSPSTTSSPSSSTESPISVPQDTASPTDLLPPNARRLYPFSFTIEGNLEDEAIFRRDLELYMLGAMKESIPALQDIALDSAPSEFDQRRLQQATLLRYEGIATLDMQDIFNSGPPPSAEEIQSAQQASLEAYDSVQAFLDDSSAQPLTILQVRVSDFDAVQVDDSGLDRAFASQNQESDNNSTSIIIGAVAGILVLGVLISLLIWQQYAKPPPPPPYELEDASQSEDFGDIGDMNKNLKMNITKSMTDSDDAMSPQSSGSTPSRYQVGIQKSISEDGMEVIDLNKPAKHSRGFLSLGRHNEAPPPPPPPAGDGDSAFASMADARSIASCDESMAGYSLGTDGPGTAAATGTSTKTTISTPPRHTTASVLKNRASPVMQNKAQMRWFEQTGLQQKGSEGFVSSDSESQVTLGDVSNPLRDSINGVEKGTEVFLDADDEEVVSHGSEEYASSYKEEDSARGDSAMSGMSDNDSETGIYISPGKAYGALGYFEAEDEEELLGDYNPSTATPARSSYVPDDVSDVPSDERKNDRQSEQDLSGFTKAEAIERGLNDFSTPERPSKHDNAQPDFLPSGSSWEDNPEIMNAWVRERRRIKRQARNRREERKQPPLTMEI